MKHTQGQWEAVVIEELALPKANYFGVNSGTSKVIAVTGTTGAADEEESIANSFLIARAPSMLNLLEESLVTLAGQIVHDQTCYDPDDPTGGTADGQCLKCRLKREIEIARGEIEPEFVENRFYPGTKAPEKDDIYQLKDGKFARYENGQWYFAFGDEGDAAKTTLKAGFMSPQFRIHESYKWREIGGAHA